MLQDKNQHPEQRREIDRLVYEPYGLTEDEIAVVEGKMSESLIRQITLMTQIERKSEVG